MATGAWLKVCLKCKKFYLGTDKDDTCKKCEEEK